MCPNFGQDHYAAQYAGNLRRVVGKRNQNEIAKKVNISWRHLMLWRTMRGVLPPEKIEEIRTIVLGQAA
jgi:hypothetical protein